MGKMRKKFAQQYGFVVPEVRVADDFAIPPKSYQIKVHGTVVAEYSMRVGEIMVLVGSRDVPEIPGEEIREPAFGMRAYSVMETFAEDLKRENYTFADNMSVLLTHLSEVIRNNLPQLLSYKDMKALLERQDQEYRKLADEICTTHISYPGLQAVLKLLLAERVSIRNLHLIIEAIAEIAPHVRRTEQIVEHVRIRMAQQICGDLSEGGMLKVLRLGNRWDLAFHQSLKRDAKGEVREFDIDPRQLEEFGQDATKAIRKHLEAGERFVLVTEPLVGGLIGAMTRLYMEALRFMGSAIAMLIGYGGAGGPAIEEPEPQAALAAIISFSALLLLFVFDFDHEIVRALVASYTVAPVNVFFNPQAALVDVTDTVSDAFFLVLRLGSPFVAYAILVNLTIGFVNKLTPQIPVYFISQPFVIAGGMIIFYFAIGTMLSLFVDGFVDLTLAR